MLIFTLKIMKVISKSARLGKLYGSTVFTSLINLNFPELLIKIIKHTGKRKTKNLILSKVQ